MGQLLDYIAIVVEELLSRGAGVNLNGSFDLFFDIQLFAPVANIFDERLKNFHLAHALLVAINVRNARELGESNRFERRLAIVDRLPDLFRNKWHEGREQTQRCLEALKQMDESSARAVAMLRVAE